MTITLNGEYFAVADEKLLGYCGEKCARQLVFQGLDNASADFYSIIFTYPDGESFESRIEDSSVTLTSSVMRMSGLILAQVIACVIEDDKYIVVKKSNIIQLEIKPSLNEKSPPFPSADDVLRMLDELDNTSRMLTDLSGRIVDEQEILDAHQTQIDDYQSQLSQQFTNSISRIQAAAASAEEYARIAGANAQQIFINKTAIGLEKRNLFRTCTPDKTQDGVALTVNSDGSVELNGTTRSQLCTEISLCSQQTWDCVKHIPNGKYILCCNSGNGVAVCVNTYDGDTQNGYSVGRTVAFSSDGQNKEFTVTDEFPYSNVAVYLDPDLELDERTVRVMIVYQGVSDTNWEPYTSSLQEQIDQLRESIGSAVPRRISSGVNLALTASGSIYNDSPQTGEPPLEQ